MPGPRLVRSHLAPSVGVGLLLMSAALVFAQSASAAGCYFPDGGCGVGLLGANTATPLTGTYTSSSNVTEQSSLQGFSKGLRIRRNGNFSNWFYSSNLTHEIYYALGATQHQCKNAAATAQTMRCRFA